MRIIFKKKRKTKNGVFSCFFRGKVLSPFVWEINDAGKDWLDIAYIPFSAYCQGMHFYIQSQTVRTAVKVNALRKTYYNIAKAFGLMRAHTLVLLQ